MARVRQHANLGSREARRRLKVRAEPYWLVIERGLSLGYRKSAEGGAWIVRRYEAGRRRHLEGRLGTADDFREADGVDVLDFGQAQRKLLSEAHQDALEATGQLQTVADAVASYADHLRIHAKSAADAEVKLLAYVVPKLGQTRVSDLTESDMDAWLAWALKRRRKPRGRIAGAGSIGTKEVKDIASLDESAERLRKRKATINRVISSFKACLKRAGAADRVLKRLRKFRAVDAARLRWLTVEEARRLQNASSADFRPLAIGALLTGCRMGELLALRASDFDSRSKTILIADSKSGKPRRVPLTEDGMTLFANLTAGQAENARMFARADGSPWYRIAVMRAMRSACEGGKIVPTATFHTLRHTYASHLVQAGVPLLFVATALGHADTRMVEKHYGHLAPSHVAEMIREKLPRFVVGSSKSNVTDMRRGRGRTD
jgi:integrase